MFQEVRTEHRYDWRHKELITFDESDKEPEGIKTIGHKPISGCKLIFSHKYDLPTRDLEEGDNDDDSVTTRIVSNIDDGILHMRRPQTFGVCLNTLSSTATTVINIDWKRS